MSREYGVRRRAYVDAGICAISLKTYIYDIGATGTQIPSPFVELWAL